MEALRFSEYSQPQSGLVLVSKKYQNIYTVIPTKIIVHENQRAKAMRDISDSEKIIHNLLLSKKKKVAICVKRPKNSVKESR